MDIFAFLQDISPWWWVALALALATIEVLTFSFFLIWPALGAMVVAVALWIVPSMSGTMQILIFALLSVALTVVGRQWVVSVKPTSDNPLLNRRSAALIGRTAVVLDGFAAGGIGNVEIDGIRWRARMNDGAARPAPGTSLDVVGAEGMTLILSPQPA